MMQFLREGGFPMWFLLIFGGASIGAAGMFARRPSRDRLPLVIALTLTTIFTSIMGVFADLAAVGHHTSDQWDKYQPILTQALLQGFAESMAPGILGFGLVTLASLLVVLGLYREARGA